jgi:hypothetical protein
LNKAFNILISTFVVLYGLIHSETKYYFNIGAIETIRNCSNAFLFVLFLFTVKASIKYITTDKLLFIFICWVIVINIAYFLFIPANGQYFYSPVFLLIPFGVSINNLKKIGSYVLFFSLILSSLYIFQLFYLIFLNGNFLIIEKHYFDVFNIGGIKLTSSLIFGNSNSAGSILFLYLILAEKLLKKRLILAYIIILFSIILSGSLTAFLLGTIWLLRKKINSFGFSWFIFIIPIVVIFVYTLQINLLGFNIRMDRWTSFILLTLTNPSIILFPNNFFNPDFYSESTFIDMVLNFGLVPILIFFKILYKNKLYFVIIYFALTNSVFLPINAFIIGLLIKKIKYELSCSVR